MDCSTPGLPIHHQLPEFTQIHFHWVSDAIQPSHSLSSFSPPPLIFPSIKVFSNESVLRIRWPKYWSFSFSISLSNEYSGLISLRMDWLDLLADPSFEASMAHHKCPPKLYCSNYRTTALISRNVQNFPVHGVAKSQTRLRDWTDWRQCPSTTLAAVCLTVTEDSWLKWQSKKD